MREEKERERERERERAERERMREREKQVWPRNSVSAIAMCKIRQIEYTKLKEIDKYLVLGQISPKWPISGPAIFFQHFEHH